ncbi:ABC transporter substrate-binding protein [Bacillus sp. 31A1R]|uniref:ABC transporter substrate-binding protein n=1 Tax=Robertmurraya mangrovi TaxID=3098077 RepID=A0ABU5IX19_9BACI|nr:ABC transporter substrate-binding protein [Bacillus sp. 31A1R]MDZ5471692.1 ABC transporter substrate-binding protein [Bacillus sp. 31A1R]
MKLMKALKRTAMIGMTGALAFSLVACSGKTEEKASDNNAGSKSDSPVSIIVTNGKGEIDAQFKEAAKAFMDANPDIKVEVNSTAVGDTLNVFDKLTASGKVVTLAMFEPYAALNKYKDVGIDLSNEKWVAETTSALTNAEGQVVGFPFAVEGMGLVYNQKVMDKAVGGTFDPFTINTQDELKELLDKVKATEGVKAPVAYQTEAWSVGNHYSSLFLNQVEDPATLVNDLKAGSVDLAGNDIWNGYYNTLELLTSEEYNEFGKRPIGQYYDAAHLAVGKGESAILFNGNWAYDSLKAVAGDTFGFMPVAVDNNPDNPVNNKIAVGPTQVLVVNKKASEAEQAAAKKFLDWIVFDEAGQDFVVNKSQVISAFKNNPNTVTNPLGIAIADAIGKDRTMHFTTNFINAADWPTTVGPEVQKLIAKQSSKEDLAKYMENYFKNQQ